MSNARQIKSWLTYRHRALSKFSVHSPFVFNLIINILDDKNPSNTYQKVEFLCDDWKKNKSRIHRMDLGASGQKETVLSVGDIVKKQGVRRKFGRLLYRLAGGAEVKNMLELGTSVGISTSYLAGGNPGANLTTVEACQETQGIAAGHPMLQNNPNICFLCMPFDEALAQMIEDKNRFDLVFIDGDHRYESTLRYFGQIRQLVHEDSLLIFDDIHWSKGMEAAWAEIKAHPEVSLSIDIFQFGLVYFKKELRKQDFVLRF
jgi:predicted O-methyltransferase YrrM